MPKRFVAAGLFLVTGVALFTLGIFLVGNRHEAFSRHVILYSEFADIDGLTKGSKVQVAGFDAGQVTQIGVPSSPKSPFRVQMRINEKLHGLVRTDSVVTIDTEGVVGETFLTIHSGSPGAPLAQANAILRGKPAISMSDLLNHGLGVMDDADVSMKQLTGELNTTLDGVNTAVKNANEVLVGLKEGRGTAGMLLRDEKVAGQVRDAINSIALTASNLNQASDRINGVAGQLQQRQLPQKIDETIDQVRSASIEANRTVEQVHLSLNQALGPDMDGVSAGQNISQALMNANDATANMSEDSEAIKHNFFFKGFFSHRGYYSLSTLSPDEYRRNKLFANTAGLRSWLAVDVLFQAGADGSEQISPRGRRAIDTAIVSFGDAVFQHPVVIEGYSGDGDRANQLAQSYNRAFLVRTYLQARFPFVTKNIGVMPLSSTPPPGLKHDHWSGVCISVPAKK